MLKVLVALNLLTSGAHFAHNAVYLDRYPGPLWIPGPRFVMAVWVVVASALLLGYRAHRSDRPGWALVGIGVFVAACLSVFGHYLYGPPSAFDLLTNALIVAEGMAGVGLLLYFLAFEHRAIGSRG